jgi:hypothetical protein
MKVTIIKGPNYEQCVKNAKELLIRIVMEKLK